MPNSGKCCKQFLINSYHMNNRYVLDLHLRTRLKPLTEDPGNFWKVHRYDQNEIMYTHYLWWVIQFKSKRTPSLEASRYFTVAAPASLWNSLPLDSGFDHLKNLLLRLTYSKYLLALFDRFYKHNFIVFILTLHSNRVLYGLNKLSEFR